MTQPAASQCKRFIFFLCCRLCPNITDTQQYRQCSSINSSSICTQESKWIEGCSPQKCAGGVVVRKANTRLTHGAQFSLPSHYGQDRSMLKSKVRKLMIVHTRKLPVGYWLFTHCMAAWLSQWPWRDHLHAKNCQEKNCSASRHGLKWNLWTLLNSTSTIAVTKVMNKYVTNTDNRKLTCFLQISILYWICDSSFCPYSHENRPEKLLRRIGTAVM